MAFRKKCPTCEKVFLTTFREQVHCSVSCSNISRTVTSASDLRTYFLARIPESHPKDVCWIWQGSLNDQGYAMAFVRQGKMRASRLAYELFVGPIPDGLNILHDPLTCTSRACVNPQHLRCGSQYDNAQDRFLSETQPLGESHYRTHLLEDDIREIRRLCNQDHLKYEEIAATYDIDFITVHDIVKAKTWKHVDANTYIPPGDKKQKLQPTDFELIYQLRKEGLTLQAIAGRLGNKVTMAHIAKLCKAYFSKNYGI